MTARTKHLLVIDTSVICSAGEMEHPVSSACRETLLLILRVCHRVAMTDAIRNEWDKHMSRFSRKWWRAMAARRKAPKHITSGGVKIDMTGLSQKDQEEIKKDLFLVEAALSADRIIVSRDDSLQVALAKTPQGLKVLHSITWLNPVKGGNAQLE